MQRITGSNLIAAIGQLPRNRDYNYINPSNRSLIRIIDVNMPSGPIVIKRWNPAKGETPGAAKKETISTEMVWRLANAFYEGQPINVDRVFGASYNTRSVLESLVAHTPQFYYCYPGRIKDIAGVTSIEHGHKHIMWCPETPHENGVLIEKNTSGMAISEIPTAAAVYEALTITGPASGYSMDINVLRRHTEIQIALYLIGLQLHYRTWIAQNDLGVLYQGKPLINHDGIISSLDEIAMVGPYDGAVAAGKFIDCMWFENNHLMPAVMEVEHTTGVTSGLDRMLNFKKKIPPIEGTRYVIVAPDDDRQEVFEKATRPAFRELRPRYFSYSAVEELYDLCRRRKIRGVTEEFLDCYMDRISS